MMALPRCVIIALAALAARGAAGSPTVWMSPHLDLAPGGREETRAIIKQVATRVEDGHRIAEKGGFWILALPVAPHTTARLAIDAAPSSTAPAIEPLDAIGKPVPVHLERLGGGRYIAGWEAPATLSAPGLQRCRVSARAGAISVTGAAFWLTAPRYASSTLPQFVAVLAAGNEQLARDLKPRHTANPTLLAAVTGLPSVAGDPCADIVTLKDPTPDVAAAWRSAGTTVWADSATVPDNALQVTQVVPGTRPRQENSQVSPGAPTAAFIAEEARRVTSDAHACPDGIVLPAMAYPTDDAASVAFKGLFQDLLRAPWADPAASTENLVRARIAMQLAEQRRLATDLSAVSATAARARAIEVVDPVRSLFDHVITPADAIASAGFGLLLGGISPDAGSHPLPMGGDRRPDAFALTMLEASALTERYRGIGRVCVELDPAAAEYADTLVASMLAGGVDGIALRRPFDAGVPEGWARMLGTADLLPAMLSPSTEPVAVLVGDGLALQDGRQGEDQVDALAGLALPILERGNPVRLVPMERLGAPATLRGVHVVVASFDPCKPPSQAAALALAAFVRAGGSLVYVGGSDAYSSQPAAWWSRSGAATPAAALGAALGVQDWPNTAMYAAAEPPDYIRASAIPSGVGPGRTYDLSAASSQTGSLLVRLSCPAGAAAAGVTRVTLTVNGAVAADFDTGTEVENRFIAWDTGTTTGGAGRVALPGVHWTYRFDNLPVAAAVRMEIYGESSPDVSVRAVDPAYAHTLVARRQAGVLGELFPRLRIGPSYAATVSTSEGPTAADRTVLFGLRGGGTAVQAWSVGSGVVVYAGIAPAFFSSSERAARLLRALVGYASQRVGVAYREPRALVAQGGGLIAVHTFGAPVTLPGRTTDVLAGDLDVAEDRTVPPDTSGLFVAAGAADAPPHLVFVTARLVATCETAGSTAFVVRAPRIPVLARVHHGSKVLAGAGAWDMFGRRVPVDVVQQGSTDLVRIEGDPAGVVVRLGWKQDHAAGG